jgi:phage N-6-adenine-methyltransferase
MNLGMFSSTSGEWETPREFFDTVDAVFHFTLDVCATHDNAKCGRYFTKAEDGLSQAWSGVCWMNPPYGREIALWVKRAYESSLKGAVVVCLLPARTDTGWWHDYVIAHAQSVIFIRGRLCFSRKGPAPFPSALVVFRCSGIADIGKGVGVQNGACDRLSGDVNGYQAVRVNKKFKGEKRGLI